MRKHHTCIIAIQHRRGLSTDTRLQDSTTQHHQPQTQALELITKYDTSRWSQQESEHYWALRITPISDHHDHHAVTRRQVHHIDTHLEDSTRQHGSTIHTDVYMAAPHTHTCLQGSTTVGYLGPSAARFSTHAASEHRPGNTLLGSAAEKSAFRLCGVPSSTNSESATPNAASAR